MKVLSFILILCCSHFAVAEDLIEKAVTVSSPETEPSVAKKELQDLAVEKVTFELVKDLMGDEKFEKNKAIIQNKIVKASGRYVSYLKPGELTPLTTGTGNEMNFVIRVSPLSLKTLLQNSGLLNENETSPVVIPFISFYDRVLTTAYKWWYSGDMGNKRFIVNQARTVENAMRNAFKKYQFYVVRPMEISAVQLIPVVFQNDRVSPEDRDFVGNMFQAPISLEGQVEFSRSPTGSNLYRIDLRLSAVQMSNNRPIADVSRRFETEIGLFESVIDKKMKQVMESVAQDLASQVFEAWQRGSVGTNILRLTVRGEVPIKQRESLKERIRSQIPQIKNIRERLVTGSSISYEVDSSSSPHELGQRISQLEFNGATFRQSSSSDTELVVDLRR